LKFEARLDLPVGILGQANRTRFTNPFQPRRDVDSIAHQVAVALLDPVAEMNADSKFDALFGRYLGVALDHRPLDFHRAVHRIDDAAEFNDAAVASTLDDAAVVHGDCRIDQVASKGAEPSENSILVRASKSGVADDVGYQDRGELPGLAHAVAEAGRSPVAGASTWLHFHAALIETRRAGNADPAFGS
jgi:hypothetical protein